MEDRREQLDNEEEVEREVEEIDEGLYKTIWGTCFTLIMTVVVYLLTFHGKLALLNHDVNKARIIYGGTIAFGVIGGVLTLPVSKWIYWKVISLREKKK